MEFKTIRRDHKRHGLARGCHPQDLFLVSEGVQCGNCLVLVTENKPREKGLEFA